MPTKSILKNSSATADDESAVNIVELDDTLERDSQDGGGKKKDSSKPAPAPAFKITKKKVSIAQQPVANAITAKEKPAEKEKATVAEKEQMKEKEADEVLVDVAKAVKAATKKPSKKPHDVSSELFNDDDVDYRYIITNYDFTKNRTLPKITKYEKALLVGKRAKQIEEGANPNVKVLPGQTSIDIAEEELRQRKIPFIIKRPVGNRFEYWKPVDMEVVMD